MRLLRRKSVHDKGERQLDRARTNVDQQRAKGDALRAELAQLDQDLAQAGQHAGAARSDFLRAAAAFTPFLVAETEGGARYLISTHDPFSAQLFTKETRREIRMLQRAQQALEDAGADRGRHTLLEVGGNIGTGAIEAVRRYGFDHVVAFEPEPDNFKLLRMNTILNGVDDRVECINAAIADTEGTATLSVSSRNSGAHSLSGGDVRATGAVEVPTVTFDALVERGTVDPEHASLLWMDIEGYEVHALMGARSLLERGVPVVMELNTPVLEAAGRADALLPTLEPHYTHVVRMRDLSKGNARDAFRPLAAIEDLRHEARSVKAMDILVCRVPD
jgi:FkbM family methyltransferase